MVSVSAYFYKLGEVVEPKKELYMKVAEAVAQKWFLRNFVKFTKKRLYQSFFFNKVAGP